MPYFRKVVFLELLIAEVRNTLTNIIKDISSRYDLPIILSGGVFQNKTLLSKTVKELEKSNKKVYFQQDTAINDGGISLGQAWWAVHKLRAKS